MSRSILFLIGVAGSIAAAVGACSAGGSGTTLGAGGAASSSSSSTGMGGAPASSSTGGDIITGGGGAGSGDITECDTDPDGDEDNDGFTPNQGDCNDCEHNINPDAVDTPASVGLDGGIIAAADNNCDGKIIPNPTCDDTLLLDDLSPLSAAKAVDICQTTNQDKGWGVISAKYIGADGKTPRLPGLQVGLLSKFGTNVTPRLGKSMLGLSSGHMRVPGQQGFCVDPSDPKVPTQNCQNPTSNGPAPPGFPQAVPGCAQESSIHDDIALELRLRAPSNATGFKFTFKFYSFEYPEWVCGSFNDQFVALVSPPPKGALNGNVCFDSGNNPVSINIAYFDVCDPLTKDNYSKLGCANCKTPPDPYCPKTTNELEGTGMIGDLIDIGAKTLDGGGTSWLETTTPLPEVGGKLQREFTIRFAIWDTGDHNIDSHVLIDSFTWIATPGVKVGTVPPS